MYLDAHLHPVDCSSCGAFKIVEISSKTHVSRLFANSAKQEEWNDLLRLAASNPMVFPFFGIHPWYTERLTEHWQADLEKIIKRRKKHVGIGEIGLHKNCGVDEKVQEYVFLSQLDLAEKYHVPLSLHCVGRWGKIVDILGGERRKHLPPILFHGFNGSPEILKQLEGDDRYFSFSSGALAQPKQQRLLDSIDLKHILLETDFSWLKKDATPNGAFEGLVKMYHTIAAKRGLSIIAFAQQVQENGKIYTSGSIDR